ncbi:MAG: UTP--glucose-1-phosphate uridylyltransferase GalU [Burkholderiales bacterium]
MTQITKAVFPVAGLGTRFLPATKASPKEMLPVVDKPLIQYAVEEAVAAGITQLIFITGRGKRAIEDHFDKALEVEMRLEADGKLKMLAAVQEIIPPEVSCIYVRQPEALGLGHAVLCAAPVIDDEPFAILLADDLIDGTPPVLKQMIDLYQREQCSIIGVERISPEQSTQYGVVKPASATGAGGNVQRIFGIVEKPQPAQAPSDLGVVGRYILSGRVLHCLRHVAPGAGGEIQLTDGIAALLREEPVMAYAFDGTRYDCGSKLGYLKANVDYALKHPEVGPGFREYLATLEHEVLA